jgi:2-deoxy-D-gluconate 3-dehydrogenase
MFADPLLSFEGRFILITGAAGGIGRALTGAFLLRGATVVGVDRQAMSPDMFASELSISERSRLHFIQFDLARTAEIAALVSQVTALFGRVDVLINNAGLLQAGPSYDLEEKDWDRVLGVNLKSVFFLSKAVASYMRSRGGCRIVNVASQLGLVGFPSSAAYTASKAAVANLTRSLALEWIADKIWVNAVAPGPLETPMTVPYLQTPDQRLAVGEMVPIGRIGSAEEMVGPILLLASTANTYMVGSVVAADGGYTAR